MGCYVCHNTLFLFVIDVGCITWLGFGIKCDMENFSLKNLKNKVVHFVGIGGISMSALALMLKRNGVTVQGSNECENDEVKRLQKRGVKVFVGHSKQHLQNVDAVVYSSAIGDDNEELVYARECGILILKRAELLGLIASGYKYVISVAGSHGKTTASAMIAEMFIKVGLKPTVHLGGVLNSLNTNCVIGNKRYFITESCEYKDNYLHLKPDMSIILNIDADHLDYFKTLDGVKESFFKFANNTKVGGVNVVCADDENSKELLSLENVLTFGFDKNANIRAVKVREYKPCYYSFDVCFSGYRLGNVKLNIMGRHNVYNALAVIMVAIAFEIDFCDAKKAIENFSGVKRRCQKICERKGVSIFHDYAHHPKQIDEMVKLGKRMVAKNGGRVIVVFEPHTYSRTKFLIDEFSRSLAGADRVFLLPVYSARENPVMGYDSLKLADETKKHNACVEYLESYDDAFRRVCEDARKGDVVLILGAGTIVGLADMFLIE